MEKRNNNVIVLQYHIRCQGLGGGWVWLLARFRTWQHLVFLQNSLPLCPQYSQGWNFFPLCFWWPDLYSTSQLPRHCLGNLSWTSFRMCAREAGICSQFQEHFPSSSWLLSSPWGPACHPICLALGSMAAGWTLMVAFQPPAAWLHGRAEGACIVILLPPPYGERREGKRQVRRQKTKGWATACSKIGNSTRERWIWWHSDKMPNYIATCNATWWAQGPWVWGTKTEINWISFQKWEVLFLILTGVSTWQYTGLHHIFFKFFFRTKRVVFLCSSLNIITNSIAMKYMEIF